GSARRPIAASADNQYFIAPDNGVLSFVLQTEPAAVYEITNNALFEHPVSNTFHGRDIFAPTAAHLARGTAIESVGRRIVDFVKNPLPALRFDGRNRVIAMVLRIDKFGNIITNLRPEHLQKDFRIRIAGHDVTRLCNSFSDSASGEFFAVEGSTGYTAIAIHQGSAADVQSEEHTSELQSRF